MSRWKKAWTPEEIDRLHRLYPKHGLDGTARYLNRTRHGVRYQVREQGLMIGLGSDVLLVGEVARTVGQSDTTVRSAAQRAGVGRRVGSRMHVPRKWAAAYIEVALARNEAEALRGVWLTTAQFAQRLGVEPKSVVHAGGEGSTGPLADAVKSVRTARAKGRRLLFHPQDAERAERAYREAVEKYRADAWISFAEAAERWGIPEYVVRDRRRQVRKREPLHDVLHSFTVERDPTRWGRPAMMKADEVDARADEVRAAYRAGNPGRAHAPTTEGGQSTRSTNGVSDANVMSQRHRENDRSHDRRSSRRDPGHAVPR